MLSEELTSKLVSDVNSQITFFFNILLFIKMLFYKYQIGCVAAGLNISGINAEVAPSIYYQFF